MRFLLYSLLLLPFLSCGKKYTCPSERLVPVVTGYRATDADTLLVVRYAPGTNFTQLIDTVRLNDSTQYFRHSHDSTFVTANNPDNLFAGDWDLKIINPVDSASVTISDITHQTETRTKGLFSTDPAPCTSPLTGFRRNGQLITLAAESPRTSLPAVYLSR